MSLSNKPKMEQYYHSSNDQGVFNYDRARQFVLQVNANEALIRLLALICTKMNRIVVELSDSLLVCV